MKKVISLIVGGALSVCLNAQQNKHIDSNYCDHFVCNQSDAVEVKNGICIENNKVINFYKNGRLHGSSISINQLNDRLSLQAQFEDGKLIGSLIFCNENGVVSTLAINILPNKDFVGAQKSFEKATDFPYQSYTYEFDAKGRVKCEGWVIIGEEFVMVWEKVGVWKFYDENGNCELVDFSKDDIDQKKYSRM